MIIDHAFGGRLLEDYCRAFEAFDGDAFTGLFTDDVEYRPDAFSTPLVGRNAVRAYLLEASRDRDQLEITIERHWVVAPTVLAAFHASYVRATDRVRVHSAAFLAAEVGGDGVVDRWREWVETREGAAG